MAFIDNLNAISPIQELNQEANQNAYLEHLIAEIFKIDNISIRTDLTKEQVLVFARAQLYASKFNVGIINDLLNNYMTLALSKNRNSRKELVDISRSLKVQDPDTSITEKLLGK